MVSDCKIKIIATEYGTTTEARMSGCIHPIILDGQKLPCGHCVKCKAKRRRDWSFRLGVEQRYSHTSYFITLTYADEKLPRCRGVPSLNKLDYQKFLKRLRKRQLEKFIELENLKRFQPILNKRLYNKLVNLKAKKRMPKIRYYGVGEYGTKTRRPHYHILLFNLYPSLKIELGDVWKLGRIDVGKVEPRSISYCLKYMDKQRHGKKDWRNPPFATMSTKPAIGYQYILLNEKYHIKNETLSVRTHNGNFQIMPKYFREKIFEDKEYRKELLQFEIQQLQKNKLKEIKRLQQKGEFNVDLEVQKVKDLIRIKKPKENYF